MLLNHQRGSLYFKGVTTYLRKYLLFFVSLCTLYNPRSSSVLGFEATFMKG